MHRLTGLVACLTLLVGGAAQAQTRTLLTNDGEGLNGQTLEIQREYGVGYSRVAQELRAGAAEGQTWFITEVKIRLIFADTRQVPTARICIDRHGTSDENQCLNGALDAPTRVSSNGARVVTYRHDGYAIRPGGRVWVVLYAGEHIVNVPTRSDRTATSADGWALSRRILGRRPVTGSEHSFQDIENARALRIAVRGYSVEPEPEPEPVPNARITAVRFTPAMPMRWRIAGEGCGTHTQDVYGAGEKLTYEVAYDKAVTVTGTPVLRINVGRARRNAEFVRVDSTNKTLTFTYTLSAGDPAAATGPHVNRGNLVLNGGGITTVLTGDMVDELPAALAHDASEASTAHSMDPSRAGVQATSLSVTSTPQHGTGGRFYGYKDRIALTLTMAAAVTVTGQPSAVFRLGSDARRARYVSGSGSTALVFAYEVQRDDADDDGIELLRGDRGIVLGGGAINGGDVDLLYREGCGQQSGHRVGGTLNPPPPLTAVHGYRQLKGRQLDAVLVRGHRSR